MRELNNGTEELEPPVTQKKLDKRRNLPPRKPALLGKGDVARRIQPIRGRIGTCVGVALLTVLVQPKKQAKWESEPTGHSCTPSSEDPSDKNVNLQ
ncbi:hypothetical protein BJX62DRAFT_213402 [Aspergillus germanicus]